MKRILLFLEDNEFEFLKDLKWKSKADNWKSFFLKLAKYRGDKNGR